VLRPPCRPDESLWLKAAAHRSAVAWARRLIEQVKSTYVSNLSAIKGRPALPRRAYRPWIVRSLLLISGVQGDDPAVIASGPTRRRDIGTRSTARACGSLWHDSHVGDCHRSWSTSCPERRIHDWR